MTVVFDEHRVGQVLYSGTCGSRMTLDPEQIEKLKIPGTPRSSYWHNREPTPRQPHYVKALGCDWLTADGAPVLSLNELQPYAPSLSSLHRQNISRSGIFRQMVIKISCMRAFGRSTTRDTWGPRFAFRKYPKNALPDNCTLLVEPLLAVDNGTQLQLRARGRNLTHNIEFFVPHVVIRVKRALRQPPLALPNCSFASKLFTVTLCLWLRVAPYWEFAYKGNPCDARIHAGAHLI